MTLVRVDRYDGIGQLTLNRPDRMNAITVELGHDLFSAINALGVDPLVNVIVIRGAGGNFCAGGDFDEVERLKAAGDEALRSLFDAFRCACDAIANVAVPVIAAVEGVAMAGGFELMQAADIVLVSDQARIADSHINFGMVPGGGSTARLARLIGRQQALSVLLSGDRLSGLDAVRIGLAYRSFPPQEFDDAVQRFAEKLVSRERAAVTTIKRLVHSGLDGTLPAALDAEIDAVVSHIGHGAGRNGANAFNQRGKDTR
jgi:2-(1,2-epoxy-1,2-dihydrophenyl)acetyl-CoA isomerase